MRMPYIYINTRTVYFSYCTLYGVYLIIMVYSYERSTLQCIRFILVRGIVLDSYTVVLGTLSGI